MNAWTLLDAITGNRRDELARFWINAPDDALEHLWCGPIGVATKNLIGQLTPNTQFSQAQLQLRGQLAERLKQGLRQPGALKLMMASFLFMPPGKLKIVHPELNFPAWLLPDYRLLYEQQTSPQPQAGTVTSLDFPASLGDFATNRIQLNRLLGLSNLYYIDPEDKEILQELRELRLKLARLILEAPADQVRQTFSSELGDRYIALLRSGIQCEDLLPAEETLTKELLQRLPSWPQYQNDKGLDASSFIVAMGFFEPKLWASGLMNSKAPDWILKLFPNA
jgi:hypothetical protein